MSFEEDIEKNRNNFLTSVDLFSGCGGLTLGLKQAGFKVIGAVDCEPLAVETYKVNHEEVFIWEKDIRTLSTLELKKQLKLNEGELDLLAGCPPCQGFSSLRTLNGSRKIEDHRNDLVFDYLRFVRDLRPKAIMMENVPGLSMNEFFIEFCLELKRLGYTYDYKILNTADFGVPQRRSRLVLMGGLSGPVNFVLPDPKKYTVRRAISFLPPPGNSGDLIHDLPENRTPRILDMIKKIPKDGGSRWHLSYEEQLPCHKKCNGFRDIYGRMSWDDVAPTITSGCVNPSKGRFLHPEQDRTITLREAALLQTFPVDYFFSLRRGKFAAASLIGNALPPEFVRRHACEVRKYILNMIKSKVIT